VSPIVGVRYLCSVCADVNVCQKCEASGFHKTHTFFKFRKPTQALPENKLKVPPPAPDEPKPDSGRSNKRNKPKYQGCLVSESFQTLAVVPNKPFKKSWTFKNDGEVAWPADVTFG
jgi:hypothetical protein